MSDDAQETPEAQDEQEAVSEAATPTVDIERNPTEGTESAINKEIAA